MMHMVGTEQIVLDEFEIDSISSRNIMKQNSINILETIPHYF
jgi:hypothetical protein